MRGGGGLTTEGESTNVTTKIIIHTTGTRWNRWLFPAHLVSTVPAVDVC